MENIGKNLKFNRENAKKSVYDIETDLGISHQNQYNWEKGTREPSIVHCVKLADYFGISIDELIGREDNAFQPTENTRKNTMSMFRLKELRKEFNLTQESLAEKMGLKYFNIGDWERGKCEPCIADLIKLSKIFDVSVDYLIGNSDNFVTASQAPIHATLPEDESELLSLFRALSQEDKRGVMRIARSLAKDVKGVSVPKAN